jgi:hypothetical protein
MEGNSMKRLRLVVFPPLSCFLITVLPAQNVAFNNGFFSFQPLLSVEEFLEKGAGHSATPEIPWQLPHTGG